MSKKEPNGKVVLYVEGRGAVVAEADVSDLSCVFGGPYNDHTVFKTNTLNFNTKSARYVVVGQAKVIDNGFNLKPQPWVIDEALKYTSTKFFRIIMDMMKLAQFDPYNGGHAFGNDHFCRSPNRHAAFDDGVDYSGSVDAIDAQLFNKYGFSAAMIDFVNRKYGGRDDGSGLVEGEGKDARRGIHAAAGDVQNDVAAGRSGRAAGCGTGAV